MHALRYCLIFLLAALIVAATPIPALPEGVQTAAPQVVSAGQCGVEPVVRALLVTETRTFTLFTNGRRFILYDNADGDATDVWRGEMHGEQLVATAYMTFEELRRFPDLCAALDLRGV